MSRVGKQKIKIPDSVEIVVNEGVISVKGPKGELEHNLAPEISIEVKDNEVSFFQAKKTKNSSALWGTSRAIVNNMIKGVVDGYVKKLKMVGVGYRAKKQGVDKLSLTLGFSHPVIFEIPKEVEIDVEDQTNIIIKGIDKQFVGQVAAKIRALRKPEPYKGKGIRYVDEVVRRKPGKVGKVL